MFNICLFFLRFFFGWVCVFLSMFVLVRCDSVEDSIIYDIFGSMRFISYLKYYVYE